MDFVICCKLFPERHDVDDKDIAYMLGISYKGCKGMTAMDVAELWEFFRANPTLHSNPTRYWQKILDRNFGEPDDRRLVDLAIQRFGRKSHPKARRTEPVSLMR